MKKSPTGLTHHSTNKIYQVLMLLTVLLYWIKPYLTSVDYVKSSQNELMEKELGHHDEKFINDSIFFN